MAGEANDTVSACTQVKKEGCSQIAKASGDEFSTLWMRLPRNRRPANWDKIDDPVVQLENNVCGHPLVGLPWERNLEEQRT